MKSLPVLISIAIGLLILKLLFSIFFYFIPDPWHFYSKLFERLGLISPKNGEFLYVTTGTTSIPHTPFYYVEFHFSPTVNLSNLQVQLPALCEAMNAKYLYLEPTRYPHFAVMVYSPAPY